MMISGKEILFEESFGRNISNARGQIFFSNDKNNIEIRSV